MGGGAWSTTTACNYVADTYTAYNISTLADLAKLDVNQVYYSYTLDPMLDPKGVIRECCDSEEHPETVPVILALDVTGSMGSAAKTCAAKLNDIMEKLYGNVKDVEFLMMGIGDLSYDNAPVQASQFESDVRILDQTTKIYFEGGGGGNTYESYTAAWYFGLRHTKLDCWKRGKKGVIITLGDEPLNPYLPGKALGNVMGDSTQDVDTEKLYKDASEKFDIYHVVITDDDASYRHYVDAIDKSWKKLLGQRCIFAKCDDLDTVISDIVKDHVNGTAEESGVKVTKDGISW